MKNQARHVFFSSSIDVDGLEFSEASDAELESKEFEILRTGEFYDRRYGKFSITEPLLAELVKNFDTNAYGQDIAVDINHESEKGAVAWIKSLSTRNGKLYAQLKDFTSEGKKLLKEKIYKYFSVEFAPFETVKDGKKLTIPNVVKGLAITNRPVIKELAATFLSEKDLLTKTSDMETFKAFAKMLLSEAKISPKDFGRLKELHATLSEEEQKETETEVAEAEGKVEEPAAPAEEVKAAEAAKKLSEEKKTLEVKLAEQEQEIAKLKLSEDNRDVEKTIASVTLSETNKTGFAATEDNKKALSEFVKELSTDQRVTFSELVKKITVLTDKQLSETGGDGDGDADEDKQLAEAMEEAKKLSSENGQPLHVVLSEVYKKRGIVK